MKLSRRQFTLAAMCTSALSVLPRLAVAQAYPARPVRIVVGLPAGSGSDILGRLIGQWLGERLGQQFIVDNRPGASGNIATEAVARAVPDGYTLLMAGAFNTINATLYDRLNFDFVTDLAPIAIVDRSPLVMAVNPAVPARTVPEFISYARANPGKINMASGGNGTVPHLAGALFGMMAGADMVHVPYRGSYLPDLLSGQVQVAFSAIPMSIESIRADKLRALGVTTATRSALLPEIPSVSEFVPGYEALLWDGVAGPRNMPTQVVATLNTEINAALADPAMKMRLADLGYSAVASSPAAFGKFIGGEIEKWAKVIRAADVRAE
jgi:tripartite-type tricarboxylate transporter receptor subunit TctC